MADIALDYKARSRPNISLPGIGVVLLAHGAVAWLLISLELIPNPIEIQPLMVQMLPAERHVEPLKPSPSVQPPRPKTTTRQPVSPPVLAAQTSAPATADVAEKAPAETAPPAPPARPTTAEATASAPRFDAAYLDNPAPVYPLLSRRLREEGKVYLRVFVEADGRPGRIELKTSSGSPRLDQAAEQAVWRWKFIPAKRGNEATSAWVVVPISFNLKV